MGARVFRGSKVYLKPQACILNQSRFDDTPSFKRSYCRKFKNDTPITINGITADGQEFNSTDFDNRHYVLDISMVDANRITETSENIQKINTTIPSYFQSNEYSQLFNSYYGENGYVTIT